MIKLYSTKIRHRILKLCDFYEGLLKHKELKFLEGSKETHLQEISKIQEQVMSSETFRLAFVGEYASGKTSIINILTGKQLPVSSTVSTDKSMEIPWNNVTVVDTPGLGSGLEEHNIITKEWLAKADLLVYVLTADLLTERGGERLLNILDEYKRDHRMMLVMNMIDQEGNDVSAYRNDLQSLLDPRPLDLYYPVFMSAKYKEKSVDPALDDEDRRYFQDKSRFNTFLDALNEFILNKREKAALTAPLTRLQKMSRKILFKNKFDKECVLLDLKIGIYESAIRDLKATMDEFKGHLHDLADGTAGNIFMCLDTASDVKQIVETEINSYTDKVNEPVTFLADSVSDITETLQVEGTRIDRSDLGIEVAKRIEGSGSLKAIFKVDFSGTNGENGTNEYLDSLKKQLNGMNLDTSDPQLQKGISEVLGAQNVLDLTGKLVGKVNRNVILKIGHILGHKFKPWEAVKLASKFAKAVPFINIGAAAMEAIMYIRNKKKAENYQQHLREFKEEVNEMLGQTVDETIETINTLMLAPVDDAIKAGMALLKDKKVELIKFSDQNKNLALQIESKRDECMVIYDEIYDSSADGTV